MIVVICHTKSGLATPVINQSAQADVRLEKLLQENPSLKSSLDNALEKIYPIIFGGLRRVVHSTVTGFD